MELGIRLSFVNTSAFRRGFEHPNPPPLGTPLISTATVKTFKLEEQVHYRVHENYTRPNYGLPDSGDM
jgi:hypothetical protein